MKIPHRQIDDFIKAPNPAARVILIYGPDTGLVRERAETIGKTVIADLNDPFNVALLSTDILAADPARLHDEAHALSMMGGNRLIRVREAGDKLTPLVKTYLETPAGHALIILESGGLGPRSSLRKLCETEGNAAALPCYVEDARDLSRLIRETLQAENLGIERDAIDLLASGIAGDRGKARRELEKLITYKGNSGTTITLEDVRLCCTEAGVLGLDDLVYSAGSRRPGEALHAYETLISEGINFVVIIRSLQNHFRRLFLVQSKVRQGASVDDAMKILRPAVFFKQKPAFKQQLSLWNEQALRLILERLVTLEAQCKQTDQPVYSLCGQAILAISTTKRHR